MQRTPYSADYSDMEDSTLNVDRLWFDADQWLKRDIFLFFRMSGGNSRVKAKCRSIFRLIHLTQKGTTDESTDTWDSVDWLIKNIPGNNGRAGIFGISYPGWLALVGAVDPHPALKASSEQACMGDLFLGDDFHHNGAFRLSYGLEYTYQVESGKSNISFPFPQFDLFSWYLKLGSLKNVNEKYFQE